MARPAGGQCFSQAACLNTCLHSSNVGKQLYELAKQPDVQLYRHLVRRRQHADDGDGG
jgi:hypothetical protein